MAIFNMYQMLMSNAAIDTRQRDPIATQFPTSGLRLFISNLLGIFPETL